MAYVDCTTEQEYQNNPCPETKADQITAVVVINEDASCLTAFNNTNFLADKSAGKVRIIRQVNGNYDGGSYATGKGYGGQIKRVTGITHKVALAFLYIRANIAYLNSLIGSQTKRFAFVTGNNEELNLIDTPCTFMPKAPVKGEMEQEREFTMEVEWSRKKIPLGYDVPASLATLLPAPVASAGSSVTDTGFTANWASVSGATEYLLDVSTEPDFETFVSGYNNKEVSGTSSAVTGLTAETTYYYRLSAKNLSEISGYSNVITVATTD